MLRFRLAGPCLLTAFIAATSQAADLSAGAPAVPLEPPTSPAWAVSPATPSPGPRFTDALWGEAGGTMALVRAPATPGMQTAQAFGAAIGDHTRLAVAISQLRAAGAVADDAPLAQTLSSGVSFSAGKSWRIGVTYDAIDARNPLLGPLYSSLGLLDPQDHHLSQQAGVTAATSLGGGRSLLLDVTVARTSLAGGYGVAGQMTNLTSRGFGLALVQDDAWIAGDRLGLSLRKPLPVLAWTEQMALSQVDCDGYPTAIIQPLRRTGLGDETDLSLDYARMLGGGQLTAGLAYRAEADNIHGLDDVALRLGSHWRF